jgi:hypothetical protein
MSTQPKRLGIYLATAAAVVGAGLGGAAIAGAATSTSSTPSTATSAPSSAPATNTARDPATVSHGPNETLLTGTTADKVKAAALAAVPGGTIIRVETDSAGSPYEAHVTKSDGTQVTVKVDAGFKVTATEQGFGGGPGGMPGPRGDSSSPAPTA